MQIIEVKNNLVKISYDTNQDNIVLSGFLVIKDENSSFVSQVMHLEANSKGNFAILKLLLNFDSQGFVTNYNGSIPSINSIVLAVKTEEILEILPPTNPIVFGELAQQNTLLALDRTIFEEKLLVCLESADNKKLFAKNISEQLKGGGRRVLIIDNSGEFSGKKVIAGENFKLPLNYDTINFIYERGLDDVKAQTKALIQEVFLEVQNYVKTLPDKFIPFNLFKTVVDEQYEALNLVELILLKNKLLKYYEAGIFAQHKNDFETLKLSLQTQEVTVFDLSRVEEKVQREMISYAYSLIKNLNQETYVFANVANHNSDKKLLKQVFTTEKAYSTLICSYAYKYLTELKQLSRNLILFAPIQQQTDFASYNAFLSKLGADEFVVYGKSTRHLPFIAKLSSPEPEAPVSVAPVEAEPVKAAEIMQELLDEQIKKDVDEIFIAPRSEKPSLVEITEQSAGEPIFEEPVYTEPVIQETPFEVEIVDNQADEDIFEDSLTEDDLDFIDALNIAPEQPEEIVEEPQEEIYDIPQEDSQDIIFEEEEIEGLTEQDAIFDEIEEETSQEQFIVPLQEITEENFSKTIQEDFYEEVFPDEEDNGVNQEETQEELQEESFEFEEEEEVQESIQEEPPSIDILPASIASSPILPIYSAQIEPKEEASADDFIQGDIVFHPKYGKGTVEKLINYGTKTLCSINFDNVGRRLLDPSIADIKKAT